MSGSACAQRGAAAAGCTISRRAGARGRRGEGAFQAWRAPADAAGTPGVEPRPATGWDLDARAPREGRKPATRSPAPPTRCPLFATAGPLASHLARVTRWARGSLAGCSPFAAGAGWARAISAAGASVAAPSSGAQREVCHECAPQAAAAVAGAKQRAWQGAGDLCAACLGRRAQAQRAATAPRGAALPGRLPPLPHRTPALCWPFDTLLCFELTTNMATSGDAGQQRLEALDDVAQRWPVLRPRRPALAASARGPWETGRMR